MKKVKVKTKQKQKQKQSQTVNINLGNVLKKSQPRRKSQPKQFNSSQSSGGPSISFNAPPIREYVDTSLNNRPSTLETPLLLKNTTNQQSTELGFPIQNNNPLLNQPPQQKSIAYNLGQYLLQSDIPDSQMQQNMLYIKQGYENKEISNIEEENKKNKIQSNFKKQQEAIMSQIPDDMKKAKKKPSKKQEIERKKQEELSKLKTDIGPSKSITIRPESSSLIQSDISSFLNKLKPIDEKKNAYLENAASSPRTKNVLISVPEEQTTITSAQIQEHPFVNVNPVDLMTPEGTKQKLKPPKKNFKIINPPNI
jgi:hypothetical protein